jgi:hypothetical protein
MAKQIGDIILVGTIDDITFYQMDGQGYARKKSSLTGKRVKKDPRFKRTMESAHRLGKGSRLASKVYRSLPRTEQVYALFKELKRMAVLGIKQGKNEQEVLAMLQQLLKKLNGISKPDTEVRQPIMKVQSRPIHACPRLFRVYSSKIKEVNRQYLKARQGKQLHKRTHHLRTGQRTYRQRE